MKGRILQSTTSRFRKFLIVPSIVTALAGGMLTASFASPKTTPAAEAAVGRANTAVVNALTQKANNNRTAAGRAIRVAMAQRGDMYLWGAVGPTRFDCSGLTLYSWQKAGRTIPRTSTQQRLWTRAVSFKDKKPGDLFFYNGHVSMYVGWSHGQNWMIHAPRSGQPVQVVPLRMRGLLKIGRVR
jgi:cell wall-associated NlpC family hydrolase